MGATEDLDALPQDAGAEEAVLLEQRRVLLQRALGTLTPAERSALVLRDLEGLSTEEVARALGVRPVTVRSQISNARTKLNAFCARLLRTQPGGLP
jgi:RNA polymerase sigma-70 factor (ECF subfamily)